MDTRVFWTFADLYAQRILDGITPVEPGKETSHPVEFVFHGAYPNPFNPTTILTFTLPHASAVTLDVFDINGRNVGAGFKPAQMSAGTHSFSFDGGDLSSGIYFVRLQAGEYTNTQKIVLLR